jgi:hypothetical protein
MMGDDSEAGLALVDLLNRIETGDPELIDYTFHKVESPEQVKRHVKTAHEQITEIYLKQGKSPEWIAQRLQGMSTPNAFTGVLQSYGVVGDGVTVFEQDRTPEKLAASGRFAGGQSSDEALPLPNLSNSYNVWQLVPREPFACRSNP